MNSRILEILTRLESIGLESVILRKELHKILEAGTEGNTEFADFSTFKDTTRRLLENFLNTPNRMLSHEDIRQDVILDEEASDSAIRSVIKRARKEMKACHNCRYEIKSISKKGYKLERLKACQNVSKVSKSPKNAKENTTQFDTHAVIKCPSHERKC